MNLQIFFDALSDLKDNRRLSSDAAKIFEPFLGNQFSHSFIFTAVNSTLPVDWMKNIVVVRL